MLFPGPKHNPSLLNLNCGNTKPEPIRFISNIPLGLGMMHYNQVHPHCPTLDRGFVLFILWQSLVPKERHYTGKGRMLTRQGNPTRAKTPVSTSAPDGWLCC